MVGRLITEGKSDVADKLSVYLGKFAFGRVSFLFFGRIIAVIKIANGARKCLLSFGIKPRFIDGAPSPFF